MSHVRVRWSLKVKAWEMSTLQTWKQIQMSASQTCADSRRSSWIKTLSILCYLPLQQRLCCWFLNVHPSAGFNAKHSRHLLILLTFYFQEQEASSAPSQFTLRCSLLIFLFPDVKAILRERTCAICTCSIYSLPGICRSQPYLRVYIPQI